MWTGALNEVLVWTFDLDAIDSTAVAAVLTADERERAMRFKFDVHRERFIAARGALRYALGAAADVRPEGLKFAYGTHGKPSIHGGGGPNFNLSHSEHRAMIAVTKGGPVGVDIERINPERSRPEIAERFFARQEIDDLSNLKGHEHARAFFGVWTRKEAVLKAAGTGISGGLAGFVVPSGDMPEPVYLASQNCWVGNLSSAFPYLESEGFSSAIAMLEKRPLVLPVCDRVLRIPVRRT